MVNEAPALGRYIVRSIAFPSQVVGINSDFTIAGHNSQNIPQEAQIWEVGTTVEGGFTWTTLRNVATGKYFAWDFSHGFVVPSDTPFGWVIISIIEGGYRIHIHQTSKSDIQLLSASDGTHLTVGAFDAPISPTFQWDFEPAP